MIIIHLFMGWKKLRGIGENNRFLDKKKYLLIIRVSCLIVLSFFKVILSSVKYESSHKLFNIIKILLHTDYYGSNSNFWVVLRLDDWLIFWRILRVCGPAADILEKFLYPFARSLVIIFGEFGKFVRIIGLLRLLIIWGSRNT